MLRTILYLGALVGGLMVLYAVIIVGTERSGPAGLALYIQALDLGIGVVLTWIGARGLWRLHKDRTSVGSS